MSDDTNKPDGELTPQQKAAKTRADNAAKAEAEEAAKKAAAEQAAQDATAKQAAKEEAAKAADAKRAAEVEVAEAAGQSDNTREFHKTVVEPTVTVICAIAGGRRRAGRAWPGGTTILGRDDIEDDEIDALRKDPMFAVHVSG